VAKSIDFSKVGGHVALLCIYQISDITIEKFRKGVSVRCTLHNRTASAFAALFNRELVHNKEEEDFA